MRSHFFCRRDVLDFGQYSLKDTFLKIEASYMELRQFIGTALGVPVALVTYQRDRC